MLLWLSVAGRVANCIIIPEVDRQQLLVARLKCTKVYHRDEDVKRMVDHTRSDLIFVLST